jgi:IPT/TIG domain
MHPRLAPRFLLLAALLLLVAAPAASAASKAPSITKVSPMRVKVGSKLTIKGKNFSSSRTRNTIFFRGAGGTTAFAKPTRASRTKLVIKVPSSVGKLLKRSSGKALSTRLKIRVLTTKFSKYTSSRLSPVVTGTGVPSTRAPSSGGGSGGSGGSGGTGGSNPTVVAPTCTGTDPDGDLLPTATESAIHTNPCNADSDHDGVSDGFEYQSARDLNDDEAQNPNAYAPYPGKRPYANPLDPTDANTDYDGDSLTLMQEYILWNYTVTNGATRTLSPLTYSDGEQYSAMHRDVNGHRVPDLPAAGYSKQASFLNWASANGYRNVDLVDGAPWYSGSSTNNYGLLDFNRLNGESSTTQPGYFLPESSYYDFDQDGVLSDDERDEDGDGLTNFDEDRGRMLPGYWSSCYQGEASYPVAYAGTDATDPDSDGDGIRDGADDQDHDDVPNVMELSRNAASGENDTGNKACTAAEGLPTFPDPNHAGVYGRVNPFNPCLPATFSRTCTRHPGFDGSPAPFDGSTDWYSLN